MGSCGIMRGMEQSQIRNFAIIAHIDHGKSTLADRLLELTGTVPKRQMHDQLLDSNPIERERGITIKLAPVRMVLEVQKLESGSWKLHKEVRGQKLDQASHFQPQHPTSNVPLPTSRYILNLIDTPGHVDFAYEVSRSLAACEGALLVVDATQGVQAQTIANLKIAREHGLTIIPVINKIDMPNAKVEKTWRELHALDLAPPSFSPSSNCGIPMSPICISAKTGENVEHVLEAIVARIPAPRGNPDASLRALVFSSQYDPHKGVIVFVRLVDGKLHFDPTFKGPTFNTITFLASGASIAPREIGYFTPHMHASGALLTGEVGYIATGLKDVRLANVGDTITSVHSSRFMVNRKQTNSNNEPVAMNHEPAVQPLPGYKNPKPMVFVSLFPISADEFTSAREAMEKLRLSDSACTFRPVSSAALGNGFHCGFLGLLHAEIVQERLSREFNVHMIATAPSVEYRLTLKAGIDTGKVGLTRNDVTLDAGKRKYVSIQSAAEFPDPSLIEGVQEPVMDVAIYTPKAYVGAVMQLAQEKRGEYINMKYIHPPSTMKPSDHETMRNETGNPGDVQGYTDRAMVEIEYLIPLSEMIVDFFDRLKSVTEGYASLDYEFFDYQPVDVVKVDILLNHEKVDALSFLTVRDQAQRRGRQLVERLATVIPRQQFSIPVQAAIGGRVVARTDIKPFRKDVTQKLYGGDRTRKDKLLKKQAKGKARMKMIGQVQIPQSAFFDVLKRE